MIVYYWDQILDFFGIQAAIALLAVGTFDLLHCAAERWLKHARKPLQTRQPPDRRARSTRSPSRSSPAPACPRPRARAAAALDAIVALIDSRGAVLAVAAAIARARSASCSRKQDGVTTIDLRVSEAVVGQLRFRAARRRARAGACCGW